MTRTPKSKRISLTGAECQDTSDITMFGLVFLPKSNWPSDIAAHYAPTDEGFIRRKTRPSSATPEREEDCGP
jgi:hypothetical protein